MCYDKKKTMLKDEQKTKVTLVVEIHSFFNNAAVLFSAERVFQFWYNIHRMRKVLPEAQKRAHSNAVKEFKCFQKHDPPPSLLVFT